MGFVPENIPIIEGMKEFKLSFLVYYLILWVCSVLVAIVVNIKASASWLAKYPPLATTANSC